MQPITLPAWMPDWWPLRRLYVHQLPLAILGAFVSAFLWIARARLWSGAREVAAMVGTALWQRVCAPLARHFWRVKHAVDSVVLALLWRGVGVFYDEAALDTALLVFWTLLGVFSVACVALRMPDLRGWVLRNGRLRAELLSWPLLAAFAVFEFAAADLLRHGQLKAAAATAACGAIALIVERVFKQHYAPNDASCRVPVFNLSDTAKRLFGARLAAEEPIVADPADSDDASSLKPPVRRGRRVRDD